MQVAAGGVTRADRNLSCSQPRGPGASCPRGGGAAPHMAACFSTGHALPAGGRVAALFDDQALFLFLVRHRVRRGIRLRRRLCPASRTGNSAQSSAARHNGEADFPGQIERQKSACHGKDHKRDFKHNRLLNIMRFESVCPLKDAPGSARIRPPAAKSRLVRPTFS